MNHRIEEIRLSYLIELMTYGLLLLLEVGDECLKLEDLLLDCRSYPRLHLSSSLLY